MGARGKGKGTENGWLPAILEGLELVDSVTLFLAVQCFLKEALLLNIKNQFPFEIISTPYNLRL